MDERSSILHGGTSTGISDLCSRIPTKVIVPVAILGVITFVAVALLTRTFETEAIDSDEGLLGESGQLLFNGGSDNPPAWFTGFTEAKSNLDASTTPTLVADKDAISSSESFTKIHISNARLNSSTFLELIKPFKNVKSIHIKNVTLFGEISTRLFLPELTDFKFEIEIHPQEQVFQYKTKEKLKSLLFFDKVGSWDLISQVSTLEVNVLLIADGSKVIEISKEKKEVVLTMNYCDEILKNIKIPYTSLTLGNCSVSVESIPITLSSITLGNVGFLEGQSLTQIVKSLTNLEEFFGSIPNLEVNLLDFSKTLKFLCLSGIKLNVPEGMQPGGVSAAPNIREVSLGGNVLDYFVASNFDKIFPNVETVGVFGIPNFSYELLESVLRTKASMIIMEYFPRKAFFVNEVQFKVENYLKDLGIPEKSLHFILNLAEGTGNPGEGMRVGTSVSEEQGNFFRFTLMGWYKIDTYEKYLRVLEEGRRYGEMFARDENYIGGVGGEVWPLVVPKG